ncbi:MAG: divergent PAP2 family protein [Clostridiales bacterium]|jgi:acid phosphatase family membrane protein YuiD|nr:divergent PAP2 family protein [Clostridiales bacterium]
MDFLTQVSTNFPIWAAVAAFLAAQLLKIIKDLILYKKLNLYLIISNGGIPSSHTAFVTAMATAVGMREGFETSAFAVAAVISLIVMQDAAGVRRAAGEQAEVLNKIVTIIKENTGLVMDKKLQELLGHSPVEVFAGAILGILTGIFFAVTNGYNLR